MKILKRIMCLLLTVTMLTAVFIGTTVSSSAAAFTIQRQWETKWKSVYVGGRTMYATACGIFSIVNAVGYLTGDAPDVYSVAVWANSIGAFNTSSFGGTDRSTLYPRIQAKYGDTYGFTCDVNGGSGYWATAASTTLKNHLKNGGVAIGHVPGHFIAVVGYDASSNKFHVYDSAPSSSRGTATYGATGLGDCWVTQSALSTGKLKLDWFCLLSSTAPSVDKSQLSAVLSGASKVSHKNYNAANLQTLRVAYDAAVVVNNNSSATQDQIDAAKTDLLNALLNTSAKTVLSVGKSYTCTDSGRTDNYADDKIRLTDGVKGTTDGGQTVYSGFSGTAEFVIDLGSVQKSDTYTAYFAAGNYGIAPPDKMYVDVYVSEDNQTFTKAASSSAALLITGNGLFDGSWSTYRITATSDAPLDGRYVKFIIKNSNSDSLYIWIDELEVARYTATHITDGIYISGVNSKIGAGETKIFTPAFNNGAVSSAYESANLMWTVNVVARKNTDGSYTVKSTAVGTGDSGLTYNLAADEILIAAHAWENGADTPVGDSGDNYTKLGALAVGDTVYLSGINIDYAFINIGAFISPNSNDGSSSVGSGSDVEQLAGGKLFWLTHYDNNTAEGAGVVFTEAYTGGEWWLHIAFTPTNDVNVYEITAISDGTDIGDATALSVPSGGFVYAINYGNDYYTMNGGIDYTSDNCTSATVDALTWKVGDKLKISGVNTSGKTVPTTTPNKYWYDDTYVCTANYVMYNSSSSGNTNVDYDTTVYDNMLWVTHFNNFKAEGAGAIITDSSLEPSVWNNYYAFKPVSGTNAYEITAISIGSEGKSVMPAIPEGGFVYSINAGNNYPALNSTGSTAGQYPDLPDYTSENCSTMLAAVAQWQIGDQFIFGNLDLKGETIPTTTSSLAWYDDGYVCTATYQSLSDSTEDPIVPSLEYEKIALGDINMNGVINQYDYILAKRAHFGTVNLTDAQKLVGDMNEDNNNDQYDYILVKRIHFNNYSTDKTVDIPLDQIVY